MFWHFSALPTMIHTLLCLSGNDRTVLERKCLWVRRLFQALCQKGRNVLKCESWGGLFWEGAGFISGQRVGGWEVCEGLWSSLSSVFLSQQTSVVFLTCHRRCLRCRGSVQLHSVSLVYTHMLWRSPPLRSLILCKFHQWLKGFVCCVVHECVCIPASGRPNIPSHVRTTGAVRRTEEKEGGKRGK